MKKIIAVLSIFTTAVIINGCRQDKYIPNVCFKENILPIFISKCANAGCHNPKDKEGDYDFTTYEGIMKGVTKNRPLFSEVYNKIKGSDPEMPPKKSTQLTAKEVDYIKYWINFGAENSSCSNSSCDTTSYITYASIQPIFDTWCTGCHSASSPGGGYALDSYNAVKTTANSGKLINSIKQNGLASSMPKGGGKLSACEITQIEKWVNNGMPQ